MREELVASSSSSSENGDETDLASFYYYPHHHHDHNQQQQQLHHHHHHHHNNHHHHHNNQHHFHAKHRQQEEHQQDQLVLPNGSNLDHHELLLPNSISESVQQEDYNIPIETHHQHCPIWSPNSSSLDFHGLPAASTALGVNSMTLDDPNWKFFDDDEVVDDGGQPVVVTDEQQTVMGAGAGAASCSLSRVRRSQISSISTTTTTLSPLSLSPPFSATLTNQQPATAGGGATKRYPPMMTPLKTNSLSDELIPPTPPPRRLSNRFLDMCSSYHRSNGGDDCAFGLLNDEAIVPFVGRNGSVEDSDGAGSVITTMTQSTTLDNQSGSIAGHCMTPFKYQRTSCNTSDDRIITQAVVHRSAFGTDDDVIPIGMPVAHLITPNPVFSDANSGMRRIASGLRLAQSQAMAVAGFLPHSMQIQDYGAIGDTLAAYGDDMVAVDVSERDCAEMVDINSVCSLQIAELDDIVCIYDSDRSENGRICISNDNDNDDGDERSGKNRRLSQEYGGNSISGSRQFLTAACYSDMNIIPTIPGTTTVTSLPLMELNLRQHSASNICQMTNKNRHRSSYHGEGVSSGNEPNGGVGHERMVQSTPGSPFDQRRPASFEVIGSAESLVGRVLAAEGLGKYCDPDFVAYTSREMQEALEMTREEMDMAAHQILLNERSGSLHSGNGFKNNNNSNNDNSSRLLTNLTEYNPINAINRRQSHQLLSPMSSPTLNYHYQQQNQQQQPSLPNNQLLAASTVSFGNRSIGSAGGNDGATIGRGGGGGTGAATGAGESRSILSSPHTTKNRSHKS